MLTSEKSWTIWETLAENNPNLRNLHADLKSHALIMVMTYLYDDILAHRKLDVQYTIMIKKWLGVNKGKNDNNVRKSKWLKNF